MIENVLGKAVPELQASQQFDNLGMHLLESKAQDRLFPCLSNRSLQLLIDLRDFLLDTRRVDASVGNQSLHRHARQFSADRIESTEHDGLRCVVDQYIDPGRSFEGANVASFAANDAAFDLVIGQRQRATGGGLRVVGCATFNRDRNQAFRLALGAFPGFVQDVAGQRPGVRLHFVFHLGQELRPGLFRRQTRDALQFRLREVLQVVKLLLNPVQVLLAVALDLLPLRHFLGFSLQQIHFAVEIGVALREPLFRFGEFLAPLFRFLFKVFARLEHLVLGGHVRFAKDGLRFFSSRLQHGSGLFGISSCLEAEEDPAHRRSQEQQSEVDEYLIHSSIPLDETTRFSVTMKSIRTSWASAGTSFNSWKS